MQTREQQQFQIMEILVNDSGVIVDFTANETSGLFNFKEKITGQTGNDGTKDVEMMVLLKYQSNF